MNKHVSGIDYTKAATMPVYYFTQSELQFLIAEVYLKYLNNDSKAEDAYEKGIDADFASRGVPRKATFNTAVAWPTAGSLDEKWNLSVNRNGLLCFIEITWKHGVNCAVLIIRSMLL